LVFPRTKAAGGSIEQRALEQTEDSPIGLVEVFADLGYAPGAFGRWPVLGLRHLPQGRFLFVQLPEGVLAFFGSE